MFEFWISPFVDFDFMRRALLGCLMLSLSAAPVGVFLMLRRMSLTGDAMAHAILPGAAIGFLVSGLSVISMTIGGIIAGALVTLLSGLTARKTETGEDSSLAAFYLTSLAAGVMIISLKGSSIDLLHVLFGSTLALNNEALWLLYIILTISLITLSIIFRPLVMECADPKFLKTISRSSSYAHYGFLILVVINLVSGFHAMGTLMSVGIMILPAAASRFWFQTLEPMIGFSILLASVAAYVGLVLSFYLNIPTSPLIILCLSAFYFLSIFIGRDKGIAVKWLNAHRRHLQN